MLRQASAKEIRSGEVDRRDGHIAIVMCFYPRGLRRELRDEYIRRLAPDEPLFREWKAIELKAGHDAAFRLTRYEKRFHLGPEALEDLKRLSALAKVKDVYLVCQCAIGERCHREMLLLAAKKFFRAPADKIFHAYPDFERRLREKSVGASLVSARQD